MEEEEAEVAQEGEEAEEVAAPTMAHQRHKEDRMVLLPLQSQSPWRSSVVWLSTEDSTMTRSWPSSGLN